MTQFNQRCAKKVASLFKTWGVPRLAELEIVAQHRYAWQATHSQWANQGLMPAGCALLARTNSEFPDASMSIVRG